MQVIEFLTPYFTTTNIAIYVACCCLPSWAAIFACRKLEGSPELNQKYWPFARTDFKNWGYIKFAVLNFLLLFPVRYFIAWVCVFSFTTLALILMIGHKQGTPLAKWRYTIIKYLIKPFSRLHMLMSGVFWVTQEQRRDIDYSKYLGPDWKPSFEGAGILVINHQSWLDIMVMLYTQCPSFVSKQEVLSYPGIGKIAECIQSIFLNRTDSKEKLAVALETIKERQIKAEKGEYPQLFICPEGATTNGEGIIAFKRGAFASLRAIRPMVINYWTASNIKATQDVAGFLYHTLVTTSCIVITMRIQTLPNFEPNDYFWKHHW